MRMQERARQKVGSTVECVVCLFVGLTTVDVAMEPLNVLKSPLMYCLDT